MALSQQQISQYLAHLHFTDHPGITEESLIALTRSHLEVVPFENLQVHYEHQEPSMAADALFQKVVGNRRGGYCFELNRLFYLLLKGLGFDCYPVPARVVHRRTELRPYTHRATVVNVGGKKWFIDVGFGGAGPKGAISMSTQEIQRVYGDDFRIAPDPDDYVGEYAVYRFDNGAPDKVLVFRDMPWMEADFELLNGYFSTYHRSPFVTKRVLYRCRPNGWISLVENTVTESIDGIQHVRELESADQVQDILAREFDLYAKPL